MLRGRSRWATKRTSGLSMPMPNAIVATMTTPSSRRKRAWFAERDARHVRPALAEQRKSQVVGTEVVTPLRDAMGLVDGEHRDLQLVEEVLGARDAESLGRQVQQVCLLYT